VPGATRAAGIKDVATLAGVSLKTVTNVVHERPNVAAETRARVQAAIAELGYRPSMAGRQLQSGRSNVITLAVPRIDEPYLGALAHAMIAAARPLGYALLVDETGGRPDREALAAAGYPGHSIDGVIFEALDAHHLAELSRINPTVLLGERIAGTTADHVGIDNVASARDVVAHLVATGRRSIGFLGHQGHTQTSVPSLRYRGFREAVHDAGLDTAADWHVPTGQYTREEGEARTEAALSDLASADALVCVSDLLAIGAMRALARRGIRVPQDIAVVGWDDTVDAAYHHPTLTSVAPDLRQLAERTIALLVERIEGRRDLGQAHVVPHRLVVRESSAPASGRDPGRQDAVPPPSTRSSLHPTTTAQRSVR